MIMKKNKGSGKVDAIKTICNTLSKSNLLPPFKANSVSSVIMIVALVLCSNNLVAKTIWGDAAYSNSLPLYLFVYFIFFCAVVCFILQTVVYFIDRYKK